MSIITDILDRFSGIEIVKVKLRDAGARVEQWATRVVELDRQVQEIDRRLVRIETFAEIADASQKARRRLPKIE